MSSRNFFSRWLISLSVNIGQNIEKSTLCSERSSHTCLAVGLGCRVVRRGAQLGVERGVGGGGGAGQGRGCRRDEVGGRGAPSARG